MHIGLCCSVASGHLNPTTTLGRELLRQGHRVTLLALPDAERKALSAGLAYLPIGLAEAPPGSMARQYETLGQLSGGKALRFTIQVIRDAARLWLRDMPAAVQTGGIEGLVVDQFTPAAATVAEHMGLPYVTLCNALPANREPNIPPLNFAWKYRASVGARVRNQLGYLLLDRISAPIRHTLNAQRLTWNLPPLASAVCDSPLAQITQLPACLDYPRAMLPPHFHYVGPLNDAQSEDAVEFPFDKLTGQPLIYAAMGTLQNRVQRVFQTIAAACDGLDAQLVISLGNKNQTIPSDLPGSPIVVAYAPQRELLKRAALVITHAGMNTALGTLAQGVPLVAIPITNDQPGVAARLVYAGAGEMVPLSKLSRERLGAAVQKVLAQPAYRNRAQALQAEIARCDGTQAAAEITLDALCSRRPVLRRT